MDQNIVYAMNGYFDKIKPIKTKLTPAEEFLTDIIYNYGELAESLKRFKMISVLIRQYPKLRSWDNVDLSKTVYLRYHFESFLNEAYLYRERMRFLLTDIKKKCRKKGLHDQVAAIDKILKEFLDSIQNVTTTRGYHVHQKRYKNRKIEQLENLELITDVSPHYTDLRDKEYKFLRIKLSKEIQQFSKDLEKLQNQTLKEITEFTFGELKNRYQLRPTAHNKGYKSLPGVV